MVFTPHFLQATLATETTEPMLDVDSIKAALDGIDLAGLLPDLSKVFGSLALVCRVAVLIGPVILLLLGLAYLFLSPREANYYFGYRCYYGMGSIQAWQFTQRFAGLVLGGLGLVLTVVMFLLSGSFAAMEVENMVWKALGCVVWEAVLSLLAIVAINATAAALFDRKGRYRKKPPTAS